MKTLLFNNTTFHKNLNFTVRLGEKWANVFIGEMVYIPNLSAVAEITHVVKCRFMEIPDFVYRDEHDPFCHSYNNLLDVMKNAYPLLKNLTDEEQENQTVVCLGFKIYVPYNPDKE